MVQKTAENREFTSPGMIGRNFGTKIRKCRPIASLKTCGDVKKAERLVIDRDADNEQNGIILL